MIHAISGGLGVALVSEQLKKLPHKNVVFRPVMPAVATEACVAWKGEDPSAPLKDLRGNRRARWPEHPLNRTVALNQGVDSAERFL